MPGAAAGAQHRQRGAHRGPVRLHHRALRSQGEVESGEMTDTLDHTRTHPHTPAHTRAPFY